MQTFTAAEKSTNQHAVGSVELNSMLQVHWLAVIFFHFNNDISTCILILFTIIPDLQVKVIPATEGQTVTLMCSTSCPLTENPAAYIWYKNREFLYQDWSPWYQQLVSSEEAVRYSCAIKGYEDLRAPEVSVGEWQHLASYYLMKHLAKCVIPTRIILLVVHWNLKL